MAKVSKSLAKLSDTKFKARLANPKSKLCQMVAEIIQEKPWLHDSPTAYIDYYEKNPTTTCKKCGKVIHFSGDEISPGCKFPEPITSDEEGEEMTLEEIAFAVNDGCLDGKRPSEWVLQALNQRP